MPGGEAGSSAACTPAGTSTEFFRYGTVAATSSDPQLTDSRLGPVRRRERVRRGPPSSVLEAGAQLGCHLDEAARRRPARVRSGEKDIVFSAVTRRLERDGGPRRGWC